MKKIIAIIAAAAMLLASFAAAAEPQKITEAAMGFDISINLPEGAVYTELTTSTELTVASIKLADETKPDYYLSFASSEEYANEDYMSDMTDEELEALYELCSADCDKPTKEIKKLDNGVTVMIVKDEDYSEMGNIFTIYRGYFIQITVIHMDYKDLTDEDMQTAIDLMAGLTLVEV
jgi:hypothetical protein